MVPVLTSRYDAVLKSICSTPGHLPVTPQTHDALHGTEEQGLHECVCCFGAVADSAHIAQPHGAQQALWQLVPCIALGTQQTHRILSLAASHGALQAEAESQKGCAYQAICRRLSPVGVLRSALTHVRAAKRCHDCALSVWNAVSAPAAGLPCPRPRTWRRR